MPGHKFKIGQTVRLSPGSIDRGAAGLYKIVALLPEERGDKQYRLQSSSGVQMRVAWETQLSAIDLP
jgi:hypothetical protein